MTLGIVSKGKKPSCLWMLPFGPWVLPFGPRGFPIDVLHLPFAPCILTCGPCILPSNHWFWPTVLVHIKANEKHQAAVQNTRCQRMPSSPKSPPPPLAVKPAPPLKCSKAHPFQRTLEQGPAFEWRTVSYHTQGVGIVAVQQRTLQLSLSLWNPRKRGGDHLFGLKVSGWSKLS